MAGKRMARAFGLLGLAALTALAFSTRSWAEADPLTKIGERIYREGIGPNGEAVEAIVQGDLSMLGTEFTCVSCHMRAGLGSLEGGVITTPTTGKRLYSPYNGVADLPMVNLGRIRKLTAAPPPRPAYTEAGVAMAIRTGVDPNGRELDPIMPRYNIEGEAMAGLIKYLNTLSAQHSPGVEEGTVHIATVITPEVRREDREAVVREMADFIHSRNMLKGYSGQGDSRRANQMRMKMLAKDIDLEALYDFNLHIWELDGDPSTWRKQLEDRYAEQPVFLLLGGISYGEWAVIHRFCEENKIPSILPNTDFPPAIGSDWYTLYFSRGYDVEGETAARYLAKHANVAKDARVVQVYRDTPAGRDLAAAFAGERNRLGASTPVGIALGANEKADPEAIAALYLKDRPDAMVLWLGKEVYPALESMAASSNRPGTVILSSTLLLEDIWNVPEPARDFVLFTFPYKLQEDKPPPALDRFRKPINYQPPFQERKVEVRARAATKLFADVLGNIRDNLYRDYVFDMIDMMGQSTFAPGGMNSMMGVTVGPDYGRLTFGPAQRVAIKGCYVVQLSPQGKTPIFLKRSEWLIH